MRPLFAQRNFALLWTAYLLSGFSETLFGVGLVVVTFSQTGSAVQTAAVMVANLLPKFAFSPLAGALADRFPRQRVMLGSLVSSALVAAALFAVIRPGGVVLWATYALMAAQAGARAFYNPARLAVLPALVGALQLVRANSVMVGTGQGVLALGYMVGGFLSLWLPLEAFVAIVLVGFAGAAGLTAMIRVASDAGPIEAVEFNLGTLARIRRGWAELRAHPVARPLVVMEVLEHVPHGMWTAAIMLVFVERALGGNAADWGYQNGAFYAGQLVGAFVAAAASRWLARWAGWAIVVDAALAGVFTVLYANSPDNAVAVAASFLFGPPFALRDVAQDTLMQTKVDARVLGRVYALRETFRVVTFLASGLGFAVLADHAPVRAIYLAGGVMYLLTALYGARNRSLRESRIA